MVNNYIILLPPSEEKKSNGDKNKIYRITKNLKQYNFFIKLNNERDFLEEKIIQLISTTKNKNNLEIFFELKGKKLQEAIEIMLDLLNEETMPAILRYNGVMFREISFINMDEKQKQNFNNSVLFIDSMFGLLKPQDLIPEYKLKITSKIKEIDIISYWKNNLRPILKYLFKDKLIIDLLPQIYRKILNFDEENNYISIRFCKIKNKKLENIGSDSKKLKGDLINYLINFENLKIENLKNFEHKEGFKFSEKYSSKNEIIYLK